MEAGRIVFNSESACSRCNMPEQINQHLDVNVSIHQHWGDPAGEHEIRIGDRPMIRCPAPAVKGRVRAEILQVLQEWESNG